MDWLAKAREALALVKEGRAALGKVVDAVKDGSAALSTTDQAELNRLLAEETAESRAAHDSLEEAIRTAGG
jgi:hypothetical protein